MTACAAGKAHVVLNSAPLQRKGFCVKTRIKRLLATGGALAALATGTAVAVAPTPAMAYDCGLTVIAYYDYPPWKRGDYAIRNCHSYTVRRKIDVALETDGPCHTIAGGATIHGSFWMHTFAYIRGMKAC